MSCQSCRRANPLQRGLQEPLPVCDEWRSCSTLRWSAHTQLAVRLCHALLPQRKLMRVAARAPVTGWTGCGLNDQNGTAPAVVRSSGSSLEVLLPMPLQLKDQLLAVDAERILHGPLHTAPAACCSPGCACQLTASVAAKAEHAKTAPAFCTHPEGAALLAHPADAVAASRARSFWSLLTCLPLACCGRHTGPSSPASPQLACTTCSGALESEIADAPGVFTFLILFERVA